MCGIAGVAGGGSSAEVHQMCDRLIHRGPDSEGFYDGDGIHLGMRRLAVMDVAAGQQPVFDERREIAAVFNGEIYNHRQLRQTLSGHVFASDCDSECLPHLYEEHGEGLPALLNGMFAVALWDGRTRSLHLFVDQLGKKPLFYAMRGQALYFASELAALLHGAHLPCEVDLAALGQYLTYRYVPAPLTAVAGIRRLEPGHGLTFTDGTVRHWRYWDLTGVQTDEADLEEQLRVRLLEATRLRMMGERPMGAFLSSGLDSAAVVAAMNRVSTQQVKTYTVGFAGDERSELGAAARVAAHLGTDHHELTVAADLAELLPRLISHVGQPLADPSLVPTYAVSAAAREHIVVALTGDGGDEVLGGYPHYLRSRAILSAMLPSGVRPLAAQFGQLAARRGPRRSAVERAASTALLTRSQTDPAVRYARFMSVFRPEDAAVLIRPEYRQAMREPQDFGFLRSVFSQTQGEPVARMMMTDIGSYLPNDLLVKADIASMACSLEVRSPLLDHTLVQWLAGVPTVHKIAEGQTKSLMRKAMRPWLPAEILGLPKRGFGVPLNAWIRGPLSDMIADTLLPKDAGLKQYLQPATVDALVRNPGPRGGLRVWALLVLEVFLREVTTR